MDAVLREVELIRVRIPLRDAFASAHDCIADKEALLVRVVTDAGEGWGECVALVAPTYTAETVDSAHMILRDYLLPRAFAGTSGEGGRGHPMARAALEGALLDASLRADGVSLATHLGSVAASVRAGVVVGLESDLGVLRDRVAAYVAQGYTRVKCKIAPGRDIDVLCAARAAAGSAVEIAADANGSYAPADRGVLHELDALALQCIEQPFAPDALRAHAELAAELTTPICLDESISGVSDARAALEMGACTAISIKPGRLGGLATAHAVHDLCVDAGAHALAGGMLETGIGRATLLAVAGLPGFTMTGDCAASDRYFADDLTEPFVLEHGCIRIPDDPGLGVQVRPEQVARYTIARERIRAN